MRAAASDSRDILKEVVRSLRGRLSQRSMSRRIGLNFNHFYRWEDGVTRFTRSDFARLCLELRLDIRGALHQTLLYRRGVGDVSALLEQNIRLSNRLHPSPIWAWMGSNRGLS